MINSSPNIEIFLDSAAGGGRLLPIKERKTALIDCGLDRCSGEGLEGYRYCQAEDFRAVPDPRRGSALQDGIPQTITIDRGSCPFFICTKGQTKTPIQAILEVAAGAIQNKKVFVLSNSFATPEANEGESNLLSLIVFISSKIRGILLFPPANNNLEQLYVPQQIDQLRYWQTWRKSKYYTTCCDQALSSEDKIIWQEWEKDLQQNYDQIIRETMLTLSGTNWFPTFTGAISQNINQGYEEEYGLPDDCHVLDYFSRYIRFYVWDLLLQGQIKMFSKTLAEGETMMRKVKTARAKDTRPVLDKLQKIYGTVTYDWEYADQFDL